MVQVGDDPDPDRLRQPSDRTCREPRQCQRQGRGRRGIEECPAAHWNVQPGDVPENTLSLLGAGYALGLLALWGTAIAFLFRYQISREDHEANLAALKRSRDADRVIE